MATGSGLTGGTITGSGTISHADTSSQASVDNSARNVIQDITLDGFGHITAINSVDASYASSDFTHNDLTGVTANEHIDWTADQGSTNIHANNYTNTTYTAGTVSYTHLTLPTIYSV